MRGHTRTGLRIGAYVASGALALSGAVLAVTPAQAAPDPAPANQAADWLQGELTGGLMHNPNFGGFDDYGLSIDTALALAAVGGHAPAVQQISDAIAENVLAYTGDPEPEPTPDPDDTDPTPETYAGSTAKAAVLAQVAGDDATAFGGTNLIQRLEGRVLGTGATTGRIEDQSAFGDYANVLGQSLAARALQTATSGKAGVVTDFLLKQQCSSGYFRLNFSAKSSANQSCVNGTDNPDTDATAFAMLQLAPQSAGNSDVAAAIAKAKSWLVAQQRCDGSFGGGTSTEGSNANSTGLVAWALGDTLASRQAATWLRARQATAADAGNDLASETGAIAYDDAGLAAGRTDGITDASSDQWRRATAQAAPGIAWFSSDPTPAISLTAPTGYYKQGTRVAVRTTGAAAGTVLCVSRTGTPVRGIASASGLSSIITLPAGTGTRTFTVKDPFGNSDTAQVRVLGAKKLTVTRTPGTVKRGAQVTVAARGLAAGEAAKIYYGSTLVRSAAASASGNLVARFSAGSSVGTKSIRAYGRFTDIRKGATTVKVVK